MIQFHPSDILSSAPDEKKKSDAKSLPCVRVCVCASPPLVRVTYLATPGAVVAVLAGPAPGLDASAAGHVAAFPWRPGRPVDVRRAGQVLVTIPAGGRAVGGENDSSGWECGVDKGATFFFFSLIFAGKQFRFERNYAIYDHFFAISAGPRCHSRCSNLLKFPPLLCMQSEPIQPQRRV